MPDAISKARRERIATEAGYRCGYCLTDQRVSGAQMHIEHLVPRARGGRSEPANLWLSCAWCNSYKGTLTEAVDPDTGETVRNVREPVQGPKATGGLRIMYIM